MASFFTRRKRSLAISSFILLILGIFLSGYYFYFIPLNREAVHKNGFLILRTIAGNIQGKSESHLTLFANFYNNVRDSEKGRQDTVAALLKQNDVAAEVKARPLAAGRQPGDPGTSDAGFDLTRVEKGYFVNTLARGYRKDSMVIREPLDSFLQPILVSQKSELFESYLLLAREEGSTVLRLVYKDAEIGMRSDIIGDSLLPRAKEAFLAGVRDIVIEDFSYRLFYYPFDAGAHHLVVCGLVKTTQYNASLNEVPFYFVYPLTIALILLLVMLPILKFRIMDANEQVRLSDVFLFCLSVITGAALVTLVVFQFILWKGGEERIKAHLQGLSGQLENSFYQEVVKMYDLLTGMDTLVSRNPSFSETLPKEKDISDTIRTYLKNKHNKQAATYLFSRVSWVDSTGAQVLKAELYGKPVFTNVSNRKYFQDFMHDAPYTLPDGSGRKFSWEAIYSWTNAEFTINVSRKSDWSKVRVAAVATPIYAIVNALLPAGYGFCIIDGDGRVQVHSDLTRNLRENLLEKIESPRKIREAMAARQQKVFNEVNFYGKRHLVFIKPLNGLPFYLVTFYDKGYLVPVNMRILIFSLLFCTVSFLISMGLLLAMVRKEFYEYPLLFSFMDCLNWIIPQKKDARFYFHAITFLFTYVAALLLFLLLLNWFYISNYIIFILVLLTPVNVMACLYVIHSALLHAVQHSNLPADHAERKRVWMTTGSHAAISVFVFWYCGNVGYPVGGQFLLFQAGVSAWMGWYGWYGWSKEDSRFFTRQWERFYLFFYSWMVTGLIICLSVLPAALFSWYAHKQEVRQMVKNQQLYLAERLHSRSKVVVNAVRKRDPSYGTGNYFRSVQSNTGIYTINHDHLSTASGYPGRGNKNEIYERFYFTVADRFSNPYYDPALYPALADSAADRSWFWQTEDTTMRFWYAVPLGNAGSGFLQVTSILPEPYLFVKVQNKGFWLLLLAMLLTLGLRKWIRINAERLFMKKYIQRVEAEDGMPQPTLIDAYFAGGQAGPGHTDGFRPAGYRESANKASRRELNLYEAFILEEVQKGEALYDYIWKACPEKERYLLYCFARNGLVNYKNTSEIYSLISKGLLIDQQQNFRLFSPGLRAYLLTRISMDEIRALQAKFRQTSAWHLFRGPFLAGLLALAAFIFFTQETVFQKFIALLAGLGSIVSFLPKIFEGLKSNDTQE